MGSIDPWRIPDWPRMEVLEGSYGIVRNLRSIYECKDEVKGQQLLEELSRRIKMHQESLQKVENFAYDLISAQFDQSESEDPSDSEENARTVSSSSREENQILLPVEEEELWILDEPEEKKTPEPAVIQEQLDYPQHVRFSPGQEISARIENALSPLEFHIIRTADLEHRSYIRNALTERFRDLIVLEQLERGAPCAVLYRKRVYRGMIQMSGTNDVLVRLVDYGSCHFVSRKRVYILPEDILRRCQPLAHFCCLADTESRRATSAVITDFSQVSAKPEVMITACGSLRDGGREIVYLPVEEQKSAKPAFTQQPARKKVKRNYARGQMDLHLPSYSSLDIEWDEDDFPTICDFSSSSANASIQVTDDSK